MPLGAISFDAVKQLVLARIEQRPARLDPGSSPGQACMGLVLSSLDSRSEGSSPWCPQERATHCRLYGAGSVKPGSRSEGSSPWCPQERATHLYSAGPAGTSTMMQ